MGAVRTHKKPSFVYRQEGRELSYRIEQIIHYNKERVKNGPFKNNLYLNHLTILAL